MQNFSFFAQFENILCLISSHRFAFKMLKNGIIIGSDHETICQDKLVTGQDQEIEYWNSKRTGPENGIMRQTSTHALCIARDSRCLPDVCLIIRLPRYHIPCPYTACPNIRSWIFLFSCTIRHYWSTIHSKRFNANWYRWTNRVRCFDRFGYAGATYVICMYVVRPTACYTRSWNECFMQVCNGPCQLEARRLKLLFCRDSWALGDVTKIIILCILRRYSHRLFTDSNQHKEIAASTINGLLEKFRTATLKRLDPDTSNILRTVI